MKRYSKITAGWGLSMYRSHDDMNPVWKDFYTKDEAYDYVDSLNKRASDYESIYLLKSGPNGSSTEDVYENNKWYTGRPAPAKSKYTYDTFSELVSQYQFDYANGKPINDIWDEIFTEYADEDLANDVTAELEDSVEVVDRNPMFSSKRIRRGRYIKAYYDIRNDLAETARSDNANDRLYVAQFPYTPKNILEKLVSDPVKKVADAARAMLEKQNKRNRTSTFLGDPITCSASKHMSILSFDFLHNGYYNESAIEDAVSEALEFCGCHLEAIDFHEVDYGGYPEYDGEQISQCSCDFSWDYDYDAYAIENALELTMSQLDSSEGGDVIGINFETYEW